MLHVQKNVPVAKAIRVVSASKRKYPLADMEVGDMFFVPDAKATLPTYCAKMGRRLGVKFNTRTCYMVLDGDEWKPSTPAEGVRGTGVWRM